MLNRERWLFLKIVESSRLLSPSTPKTCQTAELPRETLRISSASELPAAATRRSSPATLKAGAGDPGSPTSVTREHFAIDYFFMEAILNCKPEDLEDYYGLLGCDELSSVSCSRLVQDQRCCPWLRKPKRCWFRSRKEPEAGDRPWKQQASLLRDTCWCFE